MEFLYLVTQLIASIPQGPVGSKRIPRQRQIRARSVVPGGLNAHNMVDGQARAHSAVTHHLGRN